MKLVGASLRGVPSSGDLRSRKRGVPTEGTPVQVHHRGCLLVSGFFQCVINQFFFIVEVKLKLKIKDHP